MSYDDETDRDYRCLQEEATTCRHFDCIAADEPICGNIGGSRRGDEFISVPCLLKPGHGGKYHKNRLTKWSTCRRHPMCDCENCKPTERKEPHVCPEPEVIVVEADLIRNLQGFVDDITASGGTPNAYRTLRLILDKMEKGFRIP